MPKVKLVIFDAGDVLYDFRESFDEFLEKIDDLLKRKGAEVLKEEGDIWRRDDIGPAANVGRITLDEARRRHLKALGLDEGLLEEYNRIDTEVMRRVRPKEPELKSVLEGLREMGLKLAVLSDTPHSPEQKKFMLDAMGVGHLFDRVFTSSEIGHAKPDREAYEAVLEFFRVEPSEALFVAHDEDELVGAKVVGIKTVSYRGHDSGDFSAEKISEIPEIVKKIG